MLNVSCALHLSWTVEKKCVTYSSLKVGRIIGKGGANVRELQRVTGALIKLPEQGTTTGDEISVHIVGTFYSVQVW